MQPAAWMAGACLLAAAAYAAGLAGPLQFDDLPNLAVLAEWLAGDQSWQAVVFTNRSGVLGRPVSMATFVLNGLLTGSDATAMRATNLGLHLAAGVLVFVVLRRLLERAGFGARAAAQSAAFASAVWLVHPLHASTVLYVIQRMAQLSAIGLLLAMWIYLEGRDRLERGDRRGGIVLLFVVFPVVTALAALAKENGAVAPLLCAGIELAIFSRGARSRALVRWFFALFLALPAALAAALLLLRPDAVLGGYWMRDFTPYTRLLSESRVLWEYVANFVAPSGGRLGIYQDDYVASTGLISPPTTALAILGWAAVVVACIAYRKRAPLLFLGAWLFLAGHAVESTILPLDLYFEHRNYLPMLGLLLVCVDLAVRLGRAMRARVSRQLPGIAGVALLAALAFATHARARIWGEPALLAQRSHELHPASLRARLDYAGALARAGRIDLARATLAELAGRDDPDDRLIGTINLLTLQCYLGQAADGGALERLDLTRIGRLEAYHVVALNRLAAQVVGGCAGIDPAGFGRTLVALVDRSGQPDGVMASWTLRHAAAVALHLGGDEAEALEQSRRAWRARGADAGVGAFLAELALARGDADLAQATVVEARRRSHWSDRKARAVLDALQSRIDAARG